MYLRSLAMGLVAALPLAGAPVATAADLNGPYGPATADSPYDDPRYADIYRDPKPPLPPRYGERPPAAPCPGYTETCEEEERYSYAEPRDDYPRRWSRKDRVEGEYLAPMPHAPSFEYRRTRREFAEPECVHRREIRRELVRDGWSDFQDLEIRDGFAFVTARRPRGQFYRLKVDRCDGEVVHAKRIDNGDDSYAWRRRQVYPMY